MANDEQLQLNTQIQDFTAKIESAKKTLASRQEKLDKLKIQQRLREDGANQQINEVMM